MRVVVITTWLCLVGCGGDAPPADASVDAEPDATEPVEVPEPEAPEEPAPPSLVPCPAGWRETTTARGLTICKPPARRRCEGATAQRPSEDECVPIGASCPEGEFPELEGDVLHVSASATGEGTGTRDDPYRSIARAVAAAPPGGVIALGKGTFTEAFATTREVSIVGACAAETVIDSSGAAHGIRTSDAKLTIRNMTLRGGEELARVTGGGALDAEGVLFERFGARAIYVAYGNAALRDAAIRDGGPEAMDAMVCLESTCSATHVEVSRLPGNGFVAASATRLDLSDVVIDRLPDDEVRNVGVGIQLQAQVTLDSVWFSEMHSAIVATDSTVSLSRMRADALSSVSIGATESTLEVRGASFHDCNVAVFFVTGGRLTAEDIVMERGARSSMIVTADDADVHIARAWGERLASDAMAFEAGLVALEDITFLDLLPSSSGVAVTGSEGSIRRALVEGAGLHGLYVGEGSTFDVSDIAVRDTRPEPSSPFGYGVSVNGGSHVNAERISVERAQSHGLYVGESSELTGFDVRVADTLPSVASSHFGRALEVGHGARVDLTRVWFERSREFAALALIDSTITLRDAVIAGVDRALCADTTCADKAYGIGVAALNRSTIEMERFVIRDATLCGAHISAEGTLYLRDGLVANSDIGVCVETDGFDLARDTTNVRFEGAGATLDAVSLPVPDVAPSLTGDP